MNTLILKNYIKRVLITLGFFVGALVFNGIFSLFLFFGGSIFFEPIFHFAGDAWLKIFDSTPADLGVLSRDQAFADVVTFAIFVPQALVAVTWFSWRERSLKNTLLDILELLIGVVCVIFIHTVFFN